MNTKILLAALGPAVLFAVLSQLIDLSALMPTWALAFSIALLSSLLTLIIKAFRPRIASNHSKGSVATAGTGTATGKKETGSVKWFNASKGFGFITRANGEEIFVHFRSIVGQRSLRDGQRVEFAVTNGSKGLQAEEVVALK
jgi:CspA family cold shock protein